MLYPLLEDFQVVHALADAIGYNFIAYLFDTNLDGAAKLTAGSCTLPSQHSTMLRWFLHAVDQIKHLDDSSSARYWVIGLNVEYNNQETSPAQYIKALINQQKKCSEEDLTPLHHSLINFLGLT